MTAIIKFDQGVLPAGIDNRSREDIASGVAVDITNVSPGAVNTLELLWKPPEDDTAVITGSSPNWQMVPKTGTWGTYRFRLTVDGVVSEHTFDVVSPVLGLPELAPNEKADPTASLVKNTSTEIDKSETNAAFLIFTSGAAWGWWYKFRRWLRKLDALFHGTTGHTHNGTAGEGPIITTGTPPHSATSGKTVDDHHDQVHALDGGDHSATTDSTDLDASTARHGLLKKLSGVLGEYLGGTGLWESRCNIIIDGTLTDTVDNWNPTGWATADVLVLTTAGIISGFDSNIPIKCKVIANASGSPVTLKNPTGSGSSAANKFDIDAQDWVIQDSNLIQLFHGGAAWSPFARFPLDYSFNRIMMSRGDYPYYEHISVAANHILANDGSAAGLRPHAASETQAILDTSPPEVKIKLYSQTGEPTLSKAESLAVWIDTDDSNRQYLISKAGAGQKKVELT